jgi:hypothetical protein
MEPFTEPKIPDRVDRRLRVELPRPEWLVRFLLFGVLAGLVFIVPGVSILVALLRTLPGALGLIFAIFLGLVLAGFGVCLIAGSIERAVRRTAFYSDSDTLFRENRWWFFKRTSSWHFERICNLHLEWSKTQVAVRSTGAGGVSRTAQYTQWFDLILTLDDGSAVRLGLPYSMEKLLPRYLELWTLIGETPRPWWEWGTVPGAQIIKVESKPGWVRATLCPMSLKKVGPDYWLGLFFALLPIVFMTVFVVDLIGHRSVVLDPSQRAHTVAPVCMVFGAASTVFWGIGAIFLERARKCAQTVQVITCDGDKLTISSTYRGDTVARELPVSEIAEIRREHESHQAMRKVTKTIEVITYASIARAKENAGEYLCEKCQYDLRHEPATCPECGATAPPRVLGPVVPSARVECRSPQEAAWLVARLRRWLEMNPRGSG